MAEVVGRCNGACILGTQYKESCTVLLPEDKVSTISIGQSCYIFFAPAVRTFTNLKPQPSIDGEEADADRKNGVGSAIKRFPKIWSKAIMDVFSSAGVNELTQTSLIEQFKTLHGPAVISYFGQANSDLDNELWGNLKRFVTKSPFEVDSETGIIRFDPMSIKPRAPPGNKKPKLNGSDGEDVGPPSVDNSEAIMVD